MPPATDTEPVGRLVPAHDTQLFVVERGPADALPLLLLHGGPGLDHTEFGDYLDALADRYRLVLIDQRAQGRSDRDSDPASWTLQQMASDVSAVAAAIGAERYAVLGHSFGSMVALQHAADAPGAAVATVISGGVPATRFFDGIALALETFEPEHLRAQVAASWEREASVQTEQDVAELMHDQMPFHFADPEDPRIAEFHEQTARARYAPDVLRSASLEGGGLSIEVEDDLPRVSQPLLACTGRHDRICPPAASERIASLVPGAQLHIFESSGHMTFVEQNEEYLQVIGDFLDRATA